MPVWIRWLTYINPLTYEVNALRGLLIGWPTNLALDLAVLTGSMVIAIFAAAGLLGRLARG